MSIRTITRILPAQATQDGAGVHLLRALGHAQGTRLDPFLMLDAFSSDDPQDYIAGFPAHPHRGFETVTYIVDGHMRHRDHLGNEGDLKAGGVQWMTAGRGIIHEEMPQQENGLLRGFQIWLNLPAATKMQPAHYRDIPAESIPVAELSGGGFVKLIAGTLSVQDHELVGPEQGGATQPIIADISLAAGQSLDLPVPEGHQAMVYAFEGSLATKQGAVGSGHSVLLGDGSALSMTAGEQGVRVLLLAGKPLNEPIAQYGPFVMNTQAEIEQALADYRDGVLAA
ncbi:MAG: pirin family protein [Alcaligenaceae bacterium]|nr:pirin family protein [Alcaligenaceae bacterium]